MSHYMTALAMRQTGIKPATKIVLYWLADHHNSETGECHPGIRTLADECEMHRASVFRHLGELEALDLIRRAPRERENGSRTSTSYRLNLRPPPSQNATPARRKMRPPEPWKKEPEGSAGEKEECLRAREAFTDDPDGEPF